MWRGLIGLAALLCAPSAWARDPILALPLDCDLGAACFIQQYVDADPGVGAADFTCGTLSYDGHKGTDFALPSLTAMADGVDVLATAPGTVRGVRDGMPDIAADDPSATRVDGRECGNGVAISHGDGWETQYCHMRQGSIAVEAGQRVAVGTVLGQVGLSGQTVFPHIHLAVRKDGAVIDPFNPDGVVECGQIDANTLWQSPPEYRPGGLIALGFTDAVPTYDDVKTGAASASLPNAQGEALVIWAYAYGARAGDTLTLAITGPDGTVVEQPVALDRTQAQLFRALGKRTPDGGWPPGSYDGTATLTRGDDILDARTVTLTFD